MADHIDATARLKFDYLLPNQAGKHVTINSSLEQIDILVQASCLHSERLEPPSEPSMGETFIIPAGASGAWLGKDRSVATWQGFGWSFVQPNAGWHVFDLQLERLLVFIDGEWQPLKTDIGLTQNDLALGSVEQLGVNTAADDINRMAVRSEAILFTHDGAANADGDCRVMVNKSTTQSTGSIVFQNDYSGRAELGLIGDDGLSFKVSEDGSNWHTGVTLEPLQGAVSFPAGFQAPKQILENLGIYFEFPAVPDQTSVLIDLEQNKFGSLMLIYTNLISSGKGLIYCRAAAGPQIEAIATDGQLGLLTGSLEGDTGPNGQINVSCDDNGRYFLENRTGSPRNISVFLIHQF